MSKNPFSPEFLQRLKNTLRRIFRVERFPSFGQWKKFLQVLSSREKIIFLACLSLFLISGISLLTKTYFSHTQFQPKRGGVLTEGLVGQPHWLNPLYSPTNDVDRDLVELIFSGLLKYDGRGQVVPDLAEKYTISEDGTVYEFYLKKDVFWHDGKRLSSDDVIFTIETLQHPDYKSPLLANWLDVKAQKISDSQVRLELKKPYAPFLEIATLKIMPKHIWQDIPAQRFNLSPYNLKPIGSGPYKFAEIKQDKLGYIKSVTLEANRKYFGQEPFIAKINFSFFETEEGLLRAARAGTIDGFTVLLPKDLNFAGLFIPHLITIPRYFAVFSNQEKSEILADSKIRYALNYGTDKEELIKTIFGSGKEQKDLAAVVQSPLLPSLYGYSLPADIYEYNPAKAEQLLAEAGFKDNDGDGLREKVVRKENASVLKTDLKRGSQGTEVKELQKCLSEQPGIYPEKEINGVFGPATEKAVVRFQEKYTKEILEPAGLKKGTGVVAKGTRNKLNELCYKGSEETIPLKLSLVTADQELLRQTAQGLKDQWQKLGIGTEVQTLTLPQLEKEVIKKRNYELLLFGEVLSAVPDLFPFWHSSQKKDPGLNLSLYGSQASDKLLQEARQTMDSKERGAKYEQVQNQIIKAAAAIFLYQSSYLYLTAKKIKGIDLTMIVDPSKRFSTIEQWYIKTKREWK